MSIAVATETASRPHSRWRSAFFASLALVALGVALRGGDRVPADVSRPLMWENESFISAAPRRTLRIGSFNIHGGRDASGLLNLPRTAECLTGLDFAALYEAHDPLLAADQLSDLGRRLRMASLFAPTERRWWHDHFGNGLLSRVPISGWQRIPLPCTRGKAFRQALLVQLDCGEQTVQVLAVHLDSGPDRERQLRTIIPLFLALRGPAILMGDLNTTAADPQMVQLLNTPGVTNVLAEQMPRESIDWILTRGLHCVSADYQVNDASDHPLVRAEFEWP